MGDTRKWRIIALVYTVFLAVFSFINLQALDDIGPQFKDKIFHILAYALLFWLWYRSRSTPVENKIVVRMAVLIILYGMVIEVLQQVLTDSRRFDWLDALANTIGVIGVVFWHIRRTGLDGVKKN